MKSLKEYNLGLTRHDHLQGYRLQYAYGESMFIPDESIKEILNEGQQGALAIGRTKFKCPAKIFNAFISKRQKAVA